jgi:TRAP-type uncharacterized transport system substrate-binding protein
MIKNYLNRLFSRLIEPPLLYVWPTLLVILVGLLIWSLIPSPSSKLIITTGIDQGLYYKFGQQLSKELAKEGIQLEVLSSAGSVENIKRLNDPNAKTQIALLQGGVGIPSEHSNLSALSSLFNEQVWVFYRKASFKIPLTQLTALSQKRLSIGMPGSGTRALSQQLLHLNGIDLDKNTQGVIFKDLNAVDTLKALKANEVDVAILVSAPQAPIILQYLRTSELAVMSFDQADAYAIRLPFLKKVTVPRGVINLGEDIPSKDLTILATPTALVVSDDIHPALITPLMRSSEAAIENLGLLQKEGDYPSAHGFSWPHNEDAKHYLKTGPSFLHRHLPFWSVVWVDRAIRIILPLLVILIPLINYLPMLILMSVEAKTSAVYKKLRALELAVQTNSQTPWQDTLAQLQMHAMAMKVPRKYAVKVYELRMYIEMVRARLVSMK